MSLPHIVTLAGPGPEAESSAPARILAGRPVQSVRNYYADPTGVFFSGVWESTPGKWAVNYTEEEFCYLVEGAVELTDEAGNAVRFEAGSAFVVPAGFKGTWETLRPARKFYAIYERKGG